MAFTHTTKWSYVMNKTAKLMVSTPNDREIVMTRVFNAPRGLVFRAFTDASMIPRWWGRSDHTTMVERMDVRPGGAWRFVCRDPQGNEYAFKGTYLEVVPPEKLVSVPAGAKLLWRVEAVTPDGARAGSATFVSRLE